MKNLYVLVGSDGTYYRLAGATFNSKWIAEQEQRDDFNYEYDIGVDGDGFHFTILTVPDECTLASLGITTDCAERNDN